MDANEFQFLLEGRQKAVRDILTKKAVEYADDTDRLHNFHAAAGLNGGWTTEALWGMATKHIVSLADMVKTPIAFTPAEWDEKLNDALAYLHLLDAVVEELRVTEGLGAPRPVPVSKPPIISVG